MNFNDKKIVASRARRTIAPLLVKISTLDVNSKFPSPN
jgi:hypothetical protein